MVGLQRLDSSWGVKVWRWAPGSGLEARTLLAKCDYFTTREKAVEWAADLMRSDGAKVLVLDAPGLTVESMLWFKPAPELAA